VFGIPITFGACAYLTLGLIHETILLSNQANVLIGRKLEIMSDVKVVEGKAVPKLVKAYKALVTDGDKGVRDWYRLALGTSVRDFEATIVEAKESGEVRGITKNSAKFLPVIVRIFDIEGADKVSVVEICKVAETAQRALKADGALALAGLVKDWDEFEDEAVKALERKPKRNNTGAGRASSVEPTLAEPMNADGQISRALDGLRELVDLTITDFDKASELIKLVNSLVANSRAMLADSVERHPAKGEELGKRVKKIS
jgi:hypothetical protein